jgi:SAM-dependent methyltransferase
MEKFDYSKLTCLFVNTYYSSFIHKFYSINPEYCEIKYADQKVLIQNTLFGESDFYSSGLVDHGWDADDIIVNCGPLQKKWAQETGTRADGLEIAINQIKTARPHVVYLQDLNIATNEFLAEIRQYTHIVAGQIASPISKKTDYSKIDIIFTSFPHFVERFRSAGITAYYQPLAFAPKVLNVVPNTEYNDRSIKCSFVGGISEAHRKGYQLLDELADKVPIKFFGYGAELLPPHSRIKQNHFGEVWGKEMFGALTASKITVNRHIDVAENYANNMRLFEATGCGTLLITDHKDNLDDLFEIGQEVVAYRSIGDCVELIKYYLQNPHEANIIASAGRARTLKQHTYSMRMRQTSEILERHLRAKTKNNKPRNYNISHGYQPIEKNQVSEKLTQSWKNPTIAQRQREIVAEELLQMYKGKPPVAFKVLADLVRNKLNVGDSILEIGCGSGYYLEILEYLLCRSIEYTGVDYSEAMIDMAKMFYSDRNFAVADGANLPYSSQSFHTVISSCVLLTVPNFGDHIVETARVANKFIIATRTPIRKNGPTQLQKKIAYGFETMEVIFNEIEFVEKFKDAGFSLVDKVEIFGEPINDKYQFTYLFKRI